MTEEFEKNYGVKGKITGKKLLNPDNKPDAWQLRVLNMFEYENVAEFYEYLSINKKPYLRYMKPKFMTEDCVRCHGILGYKDGDLRGGVSVSIPLEPFYSAAATIKKDVTLSHFIVWLVACLAILGFAWQIHILLIKMLHGALHDSLTGLANITLFEDRLQHTFNKYKRDKNSFFAVCFLDLDRFKTINDSKGHKIGDLLLIELARRLKSLIRPGDTAARLGGDEFILLLEGIDDIGGAVMVSERVLQSFEKPFKLNGELIYTNCSVGICFVSEKYTNPDDMIRDADIAMYRAKNKGKGRVDVFNPEMHDHAQENMLIENDLRSAIKKDQLEVYYQPVIALTTNTIEGFEALLRWHHPELGFIPPDRFIPIAENTGQINKIGAWVMDKAIDQAQQWSLQFSPDKPFTMAINLSAVQMVDKSACATLKSIINKYDFDPKNIQIEVTETALIKQKEIAKAAIEKMRAFGISVSIDDFGTGYCSLSYLYEFEFDILKIDKQFVHGMAPDNKGLRLVKSLLHLSHGLGMAVVAEGVETQEEFELLNAMGCSYIQGYYFSKPQPARLIEEKLLKNCHKDAKALIPEG